MRLFALLLALLSTTSSALAADWRVQHQLRGNFADTRDAVVMAIENHGLVINFTGHIADMLARTGADIGSPRQIYEQAEVIEFCSASLSRRMMEADPHDIVLCPFTIAIYTLPGETGRTWVGYRKPSGPTAPVLEKLLRDIVSSASP